MNRFHLAIPVRDINESRAYYREVLGCVEGRSDTGWVDFNFFGHQLVCHLKPQRERSKESAASSVVDDHNIPIPHFGVVLDMPAWRELRDRLQDAGIEFVVEPYIRFKGQAGEQATMFFCDPSGNAIEIKAFKDIEKQLFAKE